MPALRNAGMVLQILPRKTKALTRSFLRCYNPPIINNFSPAKNFNQNGGQAWDQPQQIHK